MKYKITISYDGTEYGGWQVQPNRKTIQELIQDALKIILRADCPITGSGRTDAGVHARGQTAHFSYEVPFEIPPFQYSLNALLPSDIRILKIDPIDEDFHARYNVKKKIYHYHLHLSPVQSPFHYRYRTQIHAPLNLNLLEESLPHLTGTHDFSAFRGAGCGSKDPVKTLYRIEMVPEEGGIHIEFEGDGFLYKMVRNIVGTLLQIASEKRPVSDLPKLLKSKDRKQAGPTAPAQGLFLHEVRY